MIPTVSMTLLVRCLESAGTRFAAMMNYLIGRLRKAGKRPLDVRYLNKAEGDGAWCEGTLLAIDPQGLSFLRCEDGRPIAECLPWASVAAIRVDIEIGSDHDDPAQPGERQRDPFILAP